LALVPRVGYPAFVDSRAQKAVDMPRRIVLSDPESGSEGGSGSESEGGSESGSEESDEEQIVYDSEEDPLEKLEEVLDRREPPRRAQHKRRRKHYSSEESGNESDDDDSSDDDSDHSDDGDDPYVPWETLRSEYANGERKKELAGLTDHPAVHVPGWRNDGREWTQAQKDALWRSVCAKAGEDGVCRTWGIVATERQMNGEAVRVVHRVHYGLKFRDLFKGRHTGSYIEAFIPVMVKLFQQQPWQPFFNEDDVQNGTVPKPMFADFEAAHHFDNRGKDPIDLSGILVDEDWDEFGDEEGEYHGPMWCLCTECSKKGLKNITVMRHTLSGILIAVGGDCAAHMAGEARLSEMINFKLNGKSNYDMVEQILGWDA